MSDPPPDDPPPATPEDYGAPEAAASGVGHRDKPGSSQAKRKPNGEDVDLNAGLPAATKTLAPHFWDWERLRDYTPVPREWVIPGKIPQGEVTLLTGPGGLGKSTLAIMLQVAMAAGADWLGYETCQGPSIGLYAEEDHNELARRFQGVRRRLDVSWSDMTNVVYFPMKGQEITLATFNEREGWVDPAAALHEAREYIVRLGASLLILDSLNRMYASNENIRPMVTGFLRALECVATETQCAILLLGHPSKSGLVDGSGYSGSTSWDSMVRSRAYLEYQHIPDPDSLSDQEVANPLLKLSWKKANYAAKSGDIELQISFDEHAPTDDEPPIFARIEEDELDNRNLFLKIIDTLNAAGTPPRASANGRAKMMYAPTVVYKHQMNRKGRSDKARDRQITSKQCVELYRHLMTDLGLLQVGEALGSDRHKIDIVETVAMNRGETGETEEIPF